MDGNGFVAGEGRWKRPRRRGLRKRAFGLLQVAALAGLALVAGSRWPESGALDVLPIALGYGLVALALGFRIWASLFIAGYKQARLATEGPYALCRNPLYLGMLVAALGVALTTRTVTFPLLVLAGFLAYYPSVLRREEAKLSRVFGAAYRRWCATTPALIPRRLLLDNPPARTVDPRAVARQTFDALRAVGALGFVQAIAELHRLGDLPVWLRLY